MIKNNEKRMEAIQNIMTRVKYTEQTIEPLVVGDGQVQVDSSAIANMILHTVLNQMTIMNTLQDMLLKEGEVVCEADPEPHTDQN